jgi:hypothetical protein
MGIAAIGLKGTYGFIQNGVFEEATHQSNRHLLL